MRYSYRGADALASENRRVPRSARPRTGLVPDDSTIERANCMEQALGTRVDSGPRFTEKRGIGSRVMGEFHLLLECAYDIMPKLGTFEGELVYHRRVILGVYWEGYIVAYTEKVSIPGGLGGGH